MNQTPGHDPGFHGLKYALDYVRPIVAQDPVQWIGRNVDLSEDRTAQADGLVDLGLTPYMVPVIASWNAPDCRKVVVVAPEQTGKSSCWKWPLVWAVSFIRGQILVVYQSEEDAAETNRDSILPLLEAVPALKAQLDLPRAKRTTSYHFSQCIVHFAGAGADITSKPCKVVIGDELDYWRSTDGKVANVRNLEKRTRTFPKESKRILVSSTTRPTAPIWRDFEKSSRGYWYMCCLGCDKYMRSSDIRHLEWAINKAGKVKEAGIRLVCPWCKRQHRESEAKRMNAGGKYIHEDPKNKKHLGFQWGLLASPWASWLEIAEAQMEAGKTASLDAQMYLDNSVRGLPFKPRKMASETRVVLAKHQAPLPDPDSLRALFFIADTQDSGWYWIVRGLDMDDSTYKLGHGFERSLADLQARWDDEYLGIQCEAGIIDYGGHRSRDVMQFSTQPGIYMYKGSPHIGVRWSMSKKLPKLILALARQYQAELLYLIYSQQDRRNNYWYLPEDVPDDYIEQIAAMQPNPKSKFGNEYENWEAPRQYDDHYFDCEKMALVLMDWARDNFTERNWRGTRDGGDDDQAAPKPRRRKSKTKLDKW